MSGGSGMLAFYVKGNLEQTNRFLSSLKLVTLGVSLGGPESLIESPALMHHNAIPPETRQKLGILDNFVRLSVGIEDVEDIIKDI